MKFSLQNFAKLLKDLSSIASIQASDTQSLTILDIIISDLLEQIGASYAYIKFPLYDVNGDLISFFERSFGLPVEQCAIVNKFTQTELDPVNVRSIEENYFIYSIDKFSTVSSRIEEILREFQIQTIIALPLPSINISDSLFSIYFSSPPSDDPVVIGLIGSVGDVLASTYLLKMQFIRSLENRLTDAAYFLEASDPIIVLSENLDILSYNVVSANMLRDSSINGEHKLSAYLDPENEAVVQNTIALLGMNKSSSITLVAWQLPYQNEYGETTIRINFSFRKFKDHLDSIQVIASGRIQEYKEARHVEDSLGDTSELIPKLAELKQRYFKAPDETILLIKKELFPASFILVVNEETGPIALASSPDIDVYDVMQETIRLLAGLSTDQIVAQHYITGNTPWSKPEGELRWIAFYRQNNTARGNLEFHLIGIVTKQNLFAIIPNMIRISLGILLGAMNTYLEILDDDQADFVTQRFNGDRNFSTLSLIKEALDEIRLITAEVFAATLTGTNM